MSLYRQGEAEALESFPYGQICSYGMSDNNTFKITAGDRDLLFETTKVFQDPQESKSVHAALLGFLFFFLPHSVAVPEMCSVCLTLETHNLFWLPNYT